MLSAFSFEARLNGRLRARSEPLNTFERPAASRSRLLAV